MILRRHDDGVTRSEALYSDCETFRFRLSRTWGASPRLAFILLNPSTATELRNDPTIARCEGRARRTGHGGVDILNLFAFRATRPADLLAAPDPVGSGNSGIVLDTAAAAGLIVCGWGLHGAHLDQGTLLRRLLSDRGLPLWHLGLTRDGHPRHPLYVGNAVQPEPWR